MAVGPQKLAEESQEVEQEQPAPDFVPKDDIDSIIEIVLRLPWRDHEDFIFRQMLLLISTARFNDMECIALVLSALKSHGHRNFVILIIDHVFEQVLRGVEENDFKDA